MILVEGKFWLKKMLKKKYYPDSLAAIVGVCNTKKSNIFQTASCSIRMRENFFYVKTANHFFESYDNNISIIKP